MDKKIFWFYYLVSLDYRVGMNKIIHPCLHVSSGDCQLHDSCANLGSTCSSYLDCGICNRGYAADIFIFAYSYSYSYSPFLCLYLFTVAGGPCCFRTSLIASAPTVLFSYSPIFHKFLLYFLCI